MKQQRISPQIVNEKQLAEHWQVTDRRVRQMAGEGIAIRSGSGFDLVASDKAFIGWLRRDEETQRMRRRQIMAQSIWSERKISRADRLFVSREEVDEILRGAFFTLHEALRGHSGRIMGYLTAHVPSPTHRIMAMSDLRDLIIPAVNQINDQLLDHLKAAGNKFTDPLRLRIREADRNVKLIAAELGVDLEDEESVDADDSDDE